MAAEPEKMYYVGECRVCTTGPLGLRRCGGCGRVVLLCDECDSVWTDADTDQPPCRAAEDDLPCPHCGASLIERPSRWATRDEADGCDWVSRAVEEQRFTLRQGTAFSPRRNELPTDGDDESPDDG